MSGFVERKSFAEVRQLIQQRVQPGETEELGLRDALGRIVAEDITSPVDVPYFERSAMDGYAVRGEETSGASEYNPLAFKLVGVSLPGNPFEGEIASGEAVKIMTGGAVPKGANAVLMAEYSEEEDTQVRFRRQIAPGKNVMRIGEDIRRGDVVLERGRRLRPQDLGVLASVHQPDVRVYQQPTVAIIITGNELVDPSSEASASHIVDSNSYLMAGLVELYGGIPVLKGITEDRRETIKAAIEGAEEDIIVVSGGTSVGEEDYAPVIVNELGELAVHGVAIKPGSPLGLGFIGERSIFLVPGSPVAAMITTDAFVCSAVRRRLGLDAGFGYPRIRGKLKQKIVSAIGRTEFVRVQIDEDFNIGKLRVSGASILTSTTRADGFLVIDDGVEGYPEGTEVEIYHYE